MKKTTVDLFNDTCQDETWHLDQKWKMDHDKKMASMHLKKHKYELWYWSMPSSMASSHRNPVMGKSMEDKRIQILQLQSGLQSSPMVLHHP
jgi:hypothetical protein